MSWRPIAAGSLTLIVLQAFLSGKGPEAAGGLLGWLSTGLQKLMAADVAGLPTGARAAASTPSTSPSTPSAGGISGPNGLPTNPSVVTT